MRKHVKTIVVAVKIANNRFVKKTPVIISISAANVGLNTGKLMFPMVRISMLDANKGIV
jgi:hypothetical protein